ncbi:MAG TPA: hypothetical protein VG870_12710 [Chitinophagaceae bacterium]|nr:hypothetical protein [Chitinophagaceae bacterium]
MAINKNHEFEDLEGVKCAVVERQVSAERARFLKDLLEANQYQVVVVPAAPARTATPPPAAAAGQAGGESTAPAPPASEGPQVFVVGVTDVMFNATNAIFGRLLKTRDGHVVTRAYWLQQEATSDDSVPYFEKQG